MSLRVPKAPALALLDTAQELRLQVKHLPWHLLRNELDSGWSRGRNHHAQVQIKLRDLPLYMEGLQVIRCFCQLCPLMYLPLTLTSQGGSADGDTQAPLLPTPTAEAREDNTASLPNCTHTCTPFPHSKLEQTGHRCKPTPAIQPGNQLGENSSWARPHRPNACLKTGSLFLLTFCEWLLRETHSSTVYTQALFWQIKNTIENLFLYSMEHTSN